MYAVGQGFPAMTYFAFFALRPIRLPFSILPVTCRT